MYAVIRSGGKQYRVAPGDLVKIEKLPAGPGEKVEFTDVLAVSGQEGHIGPGQGALVSGQVLDSGRGNKVLVFHFKRKKQYKKIFGHRQPFTAVRITEISYDGQKFTAPEVAVRQPKGKAPAESEEGVTAQAKAGAKKKSVAKKPKAKAASKPAAKKAGKGKKEKSK